MRETNNNNFKISKKDLENQQIEDSEKYWSQILAIFIVSLGPLTNGILFSWSSPFSIVITEDKINYNITPEDTSLFIVYQPLGMLTACIYLFKLNEYLGRKKSLQSVAIPHLIAWTVIIFARNKWHFYLAKFIGGLGDGAMFLSVPSYVGEITVPKIRGYFGNTPTFFIYTGQFIITVLGSYFDVKTTAYICIGIPILFFTLVTIVLPESPYQLIKDEKYEAAKESIKWFRRKNNIDCDYYQIKSDVERQISESSKWKDLWLIESNRKAVRAGIFLRFSQQLCGISVFSAYAQPVFQKAGGNYSIQTTSIIFVGIIWILNFLCSPAVERYGRKITYFYSILLSGIVLILNAVYFGLDQYKIVNTDSFSWLPLAGMGIFTITYSFGVGVVPTLMLGELFSASIKSKGLCILMISFGLSVLISSNLFNLVTPNIGLYGIYLVFGLCCLISSCITLKWVPETKGKSLEEIQQSLKK